MIDFNSIWRITCARAIIGGVFLLLIAPAQSAELTASALIDGKFDTKSRANRAAIAIALHNQIQKLSQYLPIPRPQELSWVEQERVAISKLGDSGLASDRMLQYWSSPEFHHIKLHSYLTSINNALVCAADARTSVSREMMCWGVASLYLTDRSALDDSISTLVKAGRLPVTVKESTISNDSLGYGYFYWVYGRGILEHIVIPHLINQAR
jgi:hypothetical protein